MSAAPRPDAGALVMTQSALVLLAEDEPYVRSIVEENLRDAGYEVIAAANGTRAISTIEASSDTIQAVVTDVHLGAGPSGWDVARRARELVHDMPVVYMTAEGGADWPSQGVPNSVLILKPFAAGQIVTAVSTLLNGVAALRAQSPDA